MRDARARAGGVRTFGGFWLSLTPGPSLIHRQTLELCAEVRCWSRPFPAGGPGR